MEPISIVLKKEGDIQWPPVREKLNIKGKFTETILVKKKKKLLAHFTLQVSKLAKCECMFTRK